MLKPKIDGKLYDFDDFRMIVDEALDKYKEINNELVSEKEELEKELEDLKMENEELKSQIEDLNSEIDKLERKIYQV